MKFMRQAIKRSILALLAGLIWIGLWGMESVLATETASQKPFVCEENDAVAPALIDNMEELDQQLGNEVSISCRRSITSGAGDGLMLWSTIPSTGNIRTLVVMVEFSDIVFSKEITEEHIEEMMFAEPDENSKNYPKESLNAWYQRSSFGKLSFYGDVVKITLPETRGYYTEDADNNPKGYNQYNEEIWDQIRKLELNWADYDIDNDYIADAICFIIAGEKGKWSGQWWSKAFYGANISLDDKYQADCYIQCMEGDVVEPSTAIHEFGHGLGLPDLYGKEGTAHQTEGGIHTSDMMCTNSTELNALCKIMLGWIEEEQIQVIPYGTDLTTISLDSYAKTGDCALLLLEEGEASLFSEYYLVQYEDFYGNDAELAEAANYKEHLRIYHVDAKVLMDNAVISAKVIEAVDKDAEEAHRKVSFGERGSENGGFIWAGFGEYNCGYVPGDSLTPYSTPSTGKYPKDRAFLSPNVFSGLNIMDIQIKNSKASFQVFYETKSASSEEISITSSNLLKGNSINSLSFRGIINHDIWIADASKSPYLRKKGTTAVVAEGILDMGYPWNNNSSTGLKHYVFDISFDALYNAPLEYGTEYEVVFPAGLFVTSYGDVSKEIVVSGIYTQLDIWENVKYKIEFDREKYSDFGSDFITNEKGNMEIIGAGSNGGLYICEINPLTMEILSEKQVASEEEVPDASVRECFGKSENGRYWLMDSDWIYIMSEAEGLLFSYQINGDKGIKLGNNRVAICDSKSNQFMGIIVDLEALSARVIQVLDSTAIFPMGECYLLGESNVSGTENRAPVYKLYDGEDAFVREITFEGMDVKEIIESEAGYLVLGNQENNSYVYKLDSNFFIHSKYRIFEETGINKVSDLQGGYYICLKNGEEYILDEHFNIYSSTRNKKGTYQRIWEKEGKQYLVSAVGYDNTFLYSKTSALVIPEIGNNALENMTISEQVVLDEKGYVETQDAKSNQAYLESIVSKANETYEIEEIDNHYYLKVTAKNQDAVKYFKFNCIHIWDEGEVIEESTCAKKGKKRYVCTICSDGEKVEELETRPHTYSETWIVDKEATCAEEGSKSHHCTGENCTAKSDITSIPKLEHEWDEGEVTTAPTCVEKGEKTYTCAGCQGIRTEELAMVAHVYAKEWTVDKEATCIEEGSKSHHCTNEKCTEKTDVTVIPKKEHQWDEGKITVAPTCVKKGEKTYICTSCQKTKTEELGMVDHVYADEWTVDQEATCTEEGSKSHHCTSENCSETAEVTVIPKEEHQWNEGEVIVAPTCTEKGEKTYTCIKCLKSKTEEIEALGHEYDTEWTIDSEPSYYQEGYQSHHCTTSGCTAKTDITVIDKLLLKGTSLKNIKAKNKSFTVKWKKQAKETNGYEISYATNKKFKKAKTVTIKKNKIVSTTVKKLKVNKKYYVRIRTYKIINVNGKSIKVYSSWSKVKSVKL